MIPHSHNSPLESRMVSLRPLALTVRAAQLEDASGLRVNSNTFEEMRNLGFQFISLMSGEKPYYFWL